MRSRKHAVALCTAICLIVSGLLFSPASPLKAATEYALQFDGVDDRVTFGPATGPAGLGASSFTLELWFMRTGAGVVTSTGSGGISAVPLVTKGRAEFDGDVRDMNYFLGIDAKARVLAADFEDMSTGLNHPVYGRTAIADNIWYHAAATYDGATWRLYLNGDLDAELAVAGAALVRTPRSDSTQHAALGTAMTSLGAREGAFKGQMDEVRIWNVARSQADIQTAMTGPMTVLPAGLIGRWGLDDGTGIVALNSVLGRPNGTLAPPNVPPLPPAPPVWVEGGSAYTAGMPPAGNALRLTGTSVVGDHVSFERGPFPLTAPLLGTATFTIETWFKRQGAGVTSNTGPNNLVPLITKGRGEADGSNLDFNYFLGINGAVLSADFEEGAAGASPGLNHPIHGTTTIVNGTWYHGAVTYDGTTLRLYLNGIEEGAIAVGQPARANGLQPVAFGSALASNGATEGFFNGTLDEARIWNYARTPGQIAAGFTREIETAPGLMGRWGFNDGFGRVFDSTRQVPAGMLSGTGWSWVTSDNAALSNVPNTAPVVMAGADQGVNLPASASLAGIVNDDGVNTGSPLSIQWTQASGPAAVMFGNAASAATTASFSEIGTYVLTLTANDGEFVASDSVTVTVTAAAVNQAPAVNAGADQSITLPTHTVALAGTVTDDGLPGAAVTSQWTKVSGPGPVVFANASAAATSATFSGEGTYVLALSASDSLLPGSDTVTITVAVDPANMALKLGGTDASVTFGAAPQLGARKFTLEAWIRRDGAGAATNTGSLGIVAVPIVSKGMAEVEGGTVDMNYFMGIIPASGVLAADFEDTATGLNHPVSGNTSIPADSQWHHVAASYDGTTWRLYVDGSEDKVLVVGNFTPRFDSIQHAAIGTALNSTGVVTAGQPRGLFNGAIDEVRIWDYARSAAQVQGGTNREIPTASGLLGRFGMNEGAGATISSTSSAVTGTIVGTNFSWVGGAHMTGERNAAPIADAGADQTFTLPGVPMLIGSATDDGLSNAAVTTLWSQVSGPGTAVFATASNAVTTVEFPALGSYVLRLTASDGELSGQDDVLVEVNGVINMAPVVAAGADQTITLPNNEASLDGSVTDDGNVPGGPVSSQWSKVSGPGTVVFADASSPQTTATFSVNGTFVLQLSATDGVLSAIDTVTITVAADPANKGLKLNGTNASASFGAAPGLGASKFTIETWFRRDGAGIATFTGTGGVTAIPLVTKGMAEVDQRDNRDMNYFLGIRQTDGKLVADFEDMATGLNHPVAGLTSIPADGVWRHAAATYDGTTWRLYLNGAPDGELVVGNFTPRADSIQHAALGTALNSAGVATSGQTKGFFNGALDEARVWNYARSAAQISNGVMLEIAVPVPGLLGRFGMNEGVGTTLGDSAGANSGSIAGPATWVAGAPFSGPRNAAPVASDDLAEVEEDEAVTIGVLDNDSDANSDVLALVSVGSAAHGTVLRNADGTVTYTPADDFNGSDSFTYTISDGQGGSATATVEVTVNAVNDAPQAGDDAAETDEDTPVVIDVLANDSDADGESLLPVVIGGPDFGTVTVEADGRIAYTPAADFNGTDSFSYEVADAEGTSTAVATIAVHAVNDAPVVVGDSYSVDEDVMLMIEAPGVLGNDSDVDGDSLGVTLVGNASHGSLTLNADGSVIYTPNANFNGSDSFTYLVNDGSVDSALATVAITVNAVNDVPSAVGESYSTSEDTALAVDAPGILANDSDLDGEALSAALVAGPSSGTLTLNANGSFSYRPNANFNGVDSFTYTSNDGTSDSNVATVSITVEAVADAALAGDDNFSTNEDELLTVAGPGVLANDSDADGDSLTVELVSNASHGSLTLNADGSFSYQASEHFNGADSFSYRVFDGTGYSAAATVAITVNAVNDLPELGDDVYSVTEDTTLSVDGPGVLGNDTDVDGTLTAVLVSSTAHGNLVFNADGSFDYTPDANFHGDDSFRYRANDGVADSPAIVVAITVTPDHDIPVAANDAFTVAEDTMLEPDAPGVLGNDTDVDGEALVTVLVSAPSHGTLVLDSHGGFTYMPAANYSGADSFSYRAFDGTSEESNVATVTINVTAAADAPVAADGSYATNAAVALIVAAPGVLGNDTDADGDALSAVLASGPSHGTLALAANGGFTYTSVAGYNGVDAFTYRATDGTLSSNVATVTITVRAVNAAPVAVNDSYSTNEDTPLAVAAPGVLANDTDSNNDALTAVLVANAAHGMVVLNANGSFTYTPAANYNGPDSFTYRAGDGSTTSNVATVAITVRTVEDAPVAQSESMTLNEDSFRLMKLEATDAEGNDVRYTIVTRPAHGLLAQIGAFALYYPERNYNGPDSFTFKATAGGMDSNVATISLTVKAVNDAPEADGASYSTAKNQAFSGRLQASDEDGDSMTYQVTTKPTKGTVTVNAATGAFVYTPARNATGSDSFRFRASDGSANSNIAMVNITIRK